MKYGMRLKDWFDENQEHHYVYDFPEDTPDEVVEMALRGMAFMDGFSFHDTETQIYKV